MTKKLVFVYNANSGTLAAIADAIHKTVKPDTYQCQLCALSYGTVSMKKEWKEFTGSLPYPVEFLHKDEFAERYPKTETALPALFTEENTDLVEIISAEDLTHIDDLQGLMDAVSTALK